MRTDLSPSLIHHLGGSFFRPSYLIELLHGTDINNDDDVWRWSTNQDGIDWNSKTWTLYGLNITGLNWDTKITSKVTVEVENVDQVIAGIVLNEQLADKPINIWMLYLYERNIFYSDVVNVAGSSKLVITDPIPADTPSTGEIYIGAGTALTGTGSTSYSYTSWSGRTFNLSSTLSTTIPNGQQCYLLKTEYDLEDAVKVFSGVVDDIELDEKKCTINLAPESTKTQYTPRRYINKNNGFNFLPQTGLKIWWGGQNYILEKAKY